MQGAEEGFCTLHFLRKRNIRNCAPWRTPAPSAVASATISLRASTHNRVFLFDRKGTFLSNKKCRPLRIGILISSELEKGLEPSTY